MAATATPYGLKPVKRVDGMPYSGATSEYAIASGHTGNIYQGSIVYLLSTGYISFCTGTGADATTNDFPTGSTSASGALGVFMGCEYVNAQGQTVHSNYFPTGTTGTIKAKVVTDPFVLFQAQLSGVGTIAVLGANTFLAAAQSTSTGSTTTGRSTSALHHTVVTTTAAFRIVELASPATDAYQDVLVKFNPGYHSMLLNIGI